MSVDLLLVKEDLDKFRSGERTDIPALLRHVDAQEEALDIAFGDLAKMRERARDKRRWVMSEGMMESIRCATCNTEIPASAGRYRTNDGDMCVDCVAEHSLAGIHRALDAAKGDG